MANRKEPGFVTTMVCVTCGAEQFFDGTVPASLTCRKCRSTVFRAFSTPVAPDDATLAQLEDQARSTAFGDASPTTSLDDVRELGA
jgi:hypothetical protein